MGRRTKRVIIYGLLVCVVFVVGGLVFVRGVIVSGLDEAIAMAQQAHPRAGDNVSALVEYAAGDTHTLKDRNSAVWALGQLRDDRALPMLEGLYTGSECDHANRLCQYELKKAIDMCTKDVPDILLVSKRRQGVQSGQSPVKTSTAGPVM